MNQITVDYYGQFRAAAGGISSEAIAMDAPTSLESVIRRLAERHGEAFGRLVTDAQGEILRGFLCFLDQQPLELLDAIDARTSGVLTLMSPIAGG